MFKKVFLRYGILITLGISSFNISCSSQKQADRAVEKIQNQQKKQKEKKQKYAKKENEQLIERHRKLQTKDVQKRMKKSRKKADRHNDGTRGFFLKR